MNYWLRAFSGRSWQAFLASDRRILAFRDKYRQRARHVQAGDVFLCYLLRIKRWVGCLEGSGDNLRRPGAGVHQIQQENRDHEGNRPEVEIRVDAGN